MSWLISLGKHVGETCRGKHLGGHCVVIVSFCAAVLVCSCGIVVTCWLVERCTSIPTLVCCCGVVLVSGCNVWLNAHPKVRCVAVFLHAFPKGLC